MAFFINSVKWFNETRNGLDFSQNLSDFTTNLKGNIGEKVKLLMEFDHELTHNFGKPFNTSTLKIETVAGENIMTLTGGNWVNIGFRKGDQIEFLDTSVGPGGIVKALVTIDSITFNKIKVTIDGAYNLGTYSEGNIRLLKELKFFKFDYQTPYDVAGVRSASNQFGSGSIYLNDAEVGSGGPRSTSFVTFNPEEPINWDTGVFRMRYVSDPYSGQPITDPQRYTQRFEIEHEFVITPYHLETYQYNPLVAPNEFVNGTLAYLFALTEIPDNAVERPIIDYDIVASIGYYNENFDGLPNGYTLDSISYFDVTEATSIDKVNFDNVTRVTAVITGALFTAGDPITVYHSKAPTEAEYQTFANTFEENWIYEGFRNTIGAVSISGDIIENLSITLDSPTQITVEFDLNFVGNEDVVFGDDYILFIALEDSNLSSDDSNRVTLLLDKQQYIKNFDETDLFEVTDFNIYNHLQDLDIDTPTTDYVGYMEDGILIDIDFKLKPNQAKNSAAGQLLELRFDLISYNTDNDVYINMYSQSLQKKTQINGNDGGFKYTLFDYDKEQPFKLKSDDQFKLLKCVYVSNDGTFATYRATFGIKITWQEERPLTAGAGSNRPFGTSGKIYNDNNGGFSVAELKDALGNPDEINFDLNYKSSNYNDRVDNLLDNWDLRMVAFCIHENHNQTNQEYTEFFTFTPFIDVWDYDTNSEYTGEVKTYDLDDNDLELGILDNQDTKIVVTFDDGETKTDVDNFEGIIRIKHQIDNSFLIYELSSLREIPPLTGGQVLKGESGSLLATKSIVDGKYTLTGLIDSANRVLDGAINWEITGRLFQNEGVFDPNTDANITGWYDASGLLTNTDNAYGTVSALDEVSAWKELKGNLPNLANSVVANQPLFDGTNFFVETAISPQRFLYWIDNDLGTQWTVFMAVTTLTSESGTNRLSLNEGSSGSSYTEQVDLFDSLTQNAGINSYDGGAFVETNETGSTRTTNDVYIVQASFNHGGDWYLKVNDVRFDAPDDTQNSPTIGATNTLTLGGLLTRSGTPVITVSDTQQGKFHEILIFANQDVSSFENSVHDYLKDKWLP